MLQSNSKKTISHEMVIYAGMSEKRNLPYSLLFDLLVHINDVVLESHICEIFSNFLPHRAAYENEIDLWVELECCGDITLIMAKKLAKVMSEYINKKSDLSVNFVLNSQDVLTRDNKILIYYLEKLIPNVHVEYRAYHGLAVLFNHEQRYLKWPCFIAIRSFDYAIEIESIMSYAWRCAELGAEAVGFRLLEQGIKRATSGFLKQLCLVQLQFMRIAAQYYEEAANETRVILEKYPNLLKSFYLTKAWGNVLSRRVNAAGYYFACAELSMNTLPEDLHSLYRLNIFALFQHLSGQIQNAFTIEKKIQYAIHQSKRKRVQITYINSINLARLHRADGNFPQAKAHYDIAFAARGKVTENDFIYANVCYGMLYEKQGEWELAFHYWLKASLWWLTAEIPEALGWRAVRSIAQPDFMPRSTLSINMIDEALLKKIIFLCAQTKKKFPSIKHKIYFFGKNDPISVTAHPITLGDIDIHTLHSPINAIAAHSLSYQNLSSLIAAILAHTFSFELTDIYGFTLYLATGETHAENFDTSSIAQ